MFQFTSKEIAQRLGQLIIGELAHRSVEVVKCPVETISVVDLIQVSEILKILSPELTVETLDHFSMNRLSVVAQDIAAKIKKSSSKIFTMNLPLPRGAWSTFEKLGEFSFRLIEMYDVTEDVNLIRVDVLYAKA